MSSSKSNRPSSQAGHAESSSTASHSATMVGAAGSTTPHGAEKHEGHQAEQTTASSGFGASAKEQLGKVASRAGDTLRHTKENVVGGIQEGRSRMDHMVADHPASSVLLAFSFGVACGVLLEMLLISHREPEPESRMQHWWHQGRDAMGDLYSNMERRVQKGLSR